MISWANAGPTRHRYSWNGSHCLVERRHNLLRASVLATLLLSRRTHQLTQPQSVCFKIHSSSARSQAELRFSGSHCNILRMNRRNSSPSSRSSSPCKAVSRSSSVLGLGKGIPADHSPVKVRRQCHEDHVKVVQHVAHLCLRRICSSDLPAREDLLEEAQGVQSFLKDGLFLGMCRVRDHDR